MPVAPLLRNKRGHSLFDIMTGKGPDAALILLAKDSSS